MGQAELFTEICPTKIWVIIRYQPFLVRRIVASADTNDWSLGHSKLAVHPSKGRAMKQRTMSTMFVVLLPIVLGLSSYVICVSDHLPPVPLVIIH